MSGQQDEIFPLGPLLEARFVRRENRFRAEVELQGEPVKVHVPNSGRMQELLTPGAAVWIQPASGAKRKTAYTLLLVQQGKRLVCLNAHLANELVAFWLQRGMLPGFAEAEHIQREKYYGKSRFDFYLQRRGRSCYAEVKSVNLLEGHTARFPDAPTQRGSKHLQELVHCREAGLDGAVLFVVMGNAASDFAVNWRTDPDFGENLQRAVAAGVEVYVYTCRIALEGIRYTGTIPLQEEKAWKSMR